MRILNRTEFLTLPGEVLFAKYTPCVFGDLTIRTTTDHEPKNDFFTQELLPWWEDTDHSDQYFDRLELIQSGGPSGSLDYECIVRDGLYDEDQLFAIFEEEDIYRLIQRLIVTMIKMPSKEQIRVACNETTPAEIQAPQGLRSYAEAVSQMVASLPSLEASPVRNESTVETRLIQKQATYDELRDGLQDCWGALNFILAFYEPGQRYLDTEAWKQAEASGRRAHANAGRLLEIGK